MNITNAINKFYFEMTIHELQLMNHSTCFPNITYNSLLYLDIIAYKDNCTVSDLASMLNIAKSAVTSKINELLNKGLVEKRQNPKDKRVFYLSVKPEVIAEYKIYDENLHRSVQTIQSKFKEEDIDTFCQILQTISNSYYEGEKNV